MEAQEGDKPQRERAGKAKKGSSEIDDMLERTLENRVKS
jgi:hypothetical protein